MYAELMPDHQLAKHIIEKSCKALPQASTGWGSSKGTISQYRERLQGYSDAKIPLVLPKYKG